MLYCNLKSSNSIQLTVWLHETSAQNTGFNTGKHRYGNAGPAGFSMALTQSSFFGKNQQKKERLESAYNFNKD